jgi:DNA-directed RNA polymerase subunit RPC12/RpoP
MSFKCFNCQKKIEEQPFKIIASIPLPPYTVIIEEKDKPTVLQREVNLCHDCSKPFRNVSVHTTIRKGR